MKKKLVSIAVGYAFMALGAQSAYAEDFERLPVEEGQSDVLDDLSEEDQKPVIGYQGNARVAKGNARVAMMAEDASAGVRAIPVGSGSGIAIGTGSYAVNESTTAVGSGATVTGNYGVALGNAAYGGTGAVSVGNESDSLGYSIAIGDKAKAGTLADSSTGGSRAVAVGAGATVSGKNSIALGADSIADTADTVSVGSAQVKRVIKNVANGAVASGSTDAITGGQLYTTNQNVSSLSTSMGSTNGTVSLLSTSVSSINGAVSSLSTSTGQIEAKLNQLNSDETIKIGSNAIANGIGNIAIGKGATSYSRNGEGAIAIGDSAGSNTKGSIAIGISAKAGQDNELDGVAIGTGANATKYRSVALGAESVTDREDVISVGSNSLKRQITNVGAGTKAYDAVNLTQVSEFLGGSISTDEFGNVVKPSYEIGGTTYNNVKAAVEAAGVLATSGGVANSVVYDNANRDQLTLGNAETATPVRVSNVAEATAGTDAVNLDQLKKAVADVGGGASPFLGGYGTGEAAIATKRGSVALGFGSVADEVNTLSVGSSTLQRRITNVADGLLSSDAATVGQVNDLLGNASANAKSAIESVNDRVASLSRSIDSIADARAVSGADPYVQVDGAGDDSDNASVVAGSYGVAIGSNAKSRGDSAVAIGADSETNGSSAVALGMAANASAVNTLAMGANATASGNNAQAIGYGASAGGNASTAIGMSAKSGGTSSIAVGNTAITDAAAGNAISIGASSNVATQNSVALGTSAKVTGTNAIALGANSLADRADSLSVGKSGSERQITNVAAGTESTDAVNLQQLQAAINGIEGGGGADAVQYDSSTHDSLTLGGTGSSTPVALRNVANGAVDESSLDAVNGSQLFATNQLVDKNTTDISDLTTHLNSGTIGLVQQSAAGAELKVGAQTDGTTVNFAGMSGDRKLTGVASGEGDTDAVNVGQLNAAIAGVDVGGADAVQYDSSTHDSLTLGGTGSSTPVALRNVANGAVDESSLDAVNGSQLFATNQLVDKNTTDISDLTTHLNSGTIGLVQQSAAGAELKVGAQTDGTTVNFAGTSGDRKLTGVASGVGDTDAVNVGQLNAAIANVEGGGTDPLAVKYDSDAKNSVTLGSAGTPVKIDNIAAGDLSLSSAEAVNGSQLFATNTRVGSLEGALTDGGVIVKDNDGNMTSLAVTYGSASKDSVTLGNGETPVTIGNVAAGALSLSSTEAVNGSQLYGSAESVASTIGGGTTVGPDGKLANTSIEVNGDRYDTVEGAIKAAAASGATDSMAVKYDNDSRTSVTLGGTGESMAVVIHNVAAGALSSSSTDAVNGSQLYGTTQNVATAIGGGTAVDSDGKLTASINVNGTDYETVAGAIQAAAQTGSGVSATSVLYDNEERTQLTLGGLTKAGEAVKLTNVANGAIAAGSSDAVNGSQLYDTAQSVASTIGGGTTVGPDGKLANTSIEVNGDRYDTVEGAIKAAATSGATDSMAVKYDDDSRTSVTLGGTGATAPIVLSNVANGVSQYDAVNFGQLSELASKVDHVDGRVSILEQAPAGGSGGSGDTGGSTGSTADWDLNAGGEKITNVGSATEKTDAVNLGQMNDAIQASVGLPAGTTAKDYTDQQIQGVRGQINDVSKNAYSGIAAATALTMIPGVDPGKTLSFGIGGATYKGYQAVAFGGEARINQNLKVKAGVGLSSGGNTVGMGASYQW